MATHEGHCPCGQVHFETMGRPIFRAICHCTICQRFNKAAFGDVLAFRAAQVSSVPDGRIDYRAHRKPALVQRGVCRDCNSPALQKLSLPLFPKIMMVPAARIADADAISQPDFHIFYEHRVADHDDGLPKARGYLPSQMTFARHMLAGLIRRRRAPATI